MNVLGGHPLGEIHLIGKPLDPRMVFCQKFFPDRFTEEGGY